jgi:3-oxocholest-4-en-26-oate---CoA ligase
VEVALVEHNVWTVFSAVAAAVPEREAIVWRDLRYTYADVTDRSHRVARLFASYGLGCSIERAELEPWQAGQDLVGLYLLNSPEYLECTLGGYAARVAPFNVNYRYVADELKYLIEDAGASALVYHGRFAPVLSTVLPELSRSPHLVQVADDSGNGLLPGAVDYEQALAAQPPSDVDAAVTPDDLYVLYTGGTTGLPKGTLWRQGDIFAASLGGDERGGNHDLEALVDIARHETERVLLNAPLMHGAAHWVALRSLLRGGTVVVNDIVDRLHPGEVWRTVARERCTRTLMIGEAFARPLLAELESGANDASSLEVIVLGGAVTSPETKARILDLLPQVTIVDTAGASETGGSLAALSGRGRVTEAGIFKPSPTSTVLDPDLTARLEPGDSTVGWFAKSGRIPLGYLGDPAKTATTFPTVAGTRWSVPGDRARLLADGTVQLLGRDSVTINSAGEKIFAEEVEQALLTHPGLDDAVVVGRPSERWGQEVVAIVSVAADAGQAPPTDEELLTAAAERVARFKLPKEIIRVATVERGPAGKADYAWARAIATAEGGTGGRSTAAPEG